MNLDFCPSCAAPMRSTDGTTYKCDNGHPFWNNAKASTAMILLRGNEALFAKRAVEPAKGLYDFPGGFVNFGEAAEAAVKREMREEAGIEVGPISLIGTAINVYMENISTVDLVYACHEWTGTINADDDVAAFEWQPINFMLSDQFAWKTYAHLHRAIADYIEAVR